MNLRLGIVGLLLACVGIAGPALAEEPVRGGTLTFGVNAGDPPHYDFHALSNFNALHVLAPHYSTLLKAAPGAYPELTGDLAQSWDVDPDAKVFTFHLHKNVKFHDGSAFSSEDVKASYERLRTPPPGVVSLRKALFADIEAIETPDADTVVFKLKATNRAMPYIFANQWNIIYSAAKLKADPRFPEKNVLGTGPFKFVEHARGSHWVGQRFDAYFKPGLPYLDGFRAMLLQGPALANAIEAGQIQAEFRGFSPSDRDRLKGVMGDKLVAQEAPWLTGMMIAFNCKKPPFDDERVRRALSLAVDRWQASETLRRTTILDKVGGFLRPGFEFAIKDEELVKLPGFAKDIKASREEAKRLLKEAGAGSLKFKLINRTTPNPYLAAGVFLIDQWRQIGVDVEQLQVADSQYLASVLAGSYDVAVDYQGDMYDEPDYQLARYLSTDLSENRAQFIDRELDKLYDAQRNIVDPAERYRRIRAFEKRLIEKAYTVPFLWWRRIVLTSPRLKGYTMSPTHLVYQQLEDVWLNPE